MYSATAVTYETYDTDYAVSELVEQITAALPDLRHKCGILFLDPDYEGEALPRKLEQALGMGIIGVTSAAMLSSEGYHSSCAMLLVLGGDDCAFSMALSEDLDGTNAEHALSVAYAKALSGLGGDTPALLFILSAAGTGCAEDDRLSILSRLCGDIPVFGGVAADRFEFAHTRVFAEGRSSDNAVALLAMGGNLRPRFVMRNVSRKHLSKSRITSSEGNIVHSIDGVSAYEYMIRHGADNTDAMSLHFTPLLVETREGDNDDGHIICRPFIALDEETGYGTTISGIPEGSAVTVQAIESADIGEASRQAMESLLGKLSSEGADYVYSTVIAMSCAARHMVLAFDKEREARLVEELFPRSLNLAGFYSFGEYCPIAVNGNEADNRLHNLSLGLCAL